MSFLNVDAESFYDRMSVFDIHIRLLYIDHCSAMHQRSISEAYEDRGKYNHKFKFEYIRHFLSMQTQLMSFQLYRKKKKGPQGQSRTEKNRTNKRSIRKVYAKNEKKEIKTRSRQ